MKHQLCAQAGVVFSPTSFGNNINKIMPSILQHPPSSF